MPPRRKAAQQVMNLRDAVMREQRAVGPKCTVTLVRDAMASDLRADLDALLADPAVAASTLSRGVAQFGIKLPAPSILRHRRKDCDCG